MHANNRTRITSHCRRLCEILSIFYLMTLQIRYLGVNSIPLVVGIFGCMCEWQFFGYLLTVLFLSRFTCTVTSNNALTWFGCCWCRRCTALHFEWNPSLLLPFFVHAVPSSVHSHLGSLLHLGGIALSNWPGSPLLKSYTYSFITTISH